MLQGSEAVSEDFQEIVAKDQDNRNERASVDCHVKKKLRFPYAEEVLGWARTRCPELLTGRNSVRPCNTPRHRPWNTFI